MKKKNSGITLIALVITIIVLLILAGVAISMISGDESILQKTETAVKHTNLAGAKESAELHFSKFLADYMIEVDDETSTQKPQEYIENIMPDGQVTSNGDYFITLENSVVTVYKGEVATEDTKVAIGIMQDNGKIIWEDSVNGNYGNSIVLPTEESYFMFSVNEDGKTATITGVKEEYAVSVQGSLDGTTTISCPLVIKDGENYITDVIIPYEVTDDSGKKYTVTAIGDFAFIGDFPAFLGSAPSTQVERFTSFVIPDTVKTVGNSAFAFSSKLESVKFPENMTSWDVSIFFYCTSLKNVNIPQGIPSLGVSVFGGCSSLTSIEIPESVITIGKQAFVGCSSLTDVKIIGNGLETIGRTSFSGCVLLSNINIPDSVTAIEDTAFASCEKLNVIELPENLTTLGEGAFWGCIGLSSINIPKGITTLGEGTFNSCHDLTSIVIPSTVTTIEENAFWNCTGLKSVYFEHEIPPTFGKDCFGKPTGEITEFFFRNSTVSDALTTNSYSTRFGKKSDNYNW